MKYITGKQLSGEIVRWQDDRGFGFIRSPQIARQVFFHIHAYHAPNKRPQVGDKIMFVLEKSHAGKLQATQVQELQSVQRQQPHRRRMAQKQTARQSSKTITLVLVAALYGILTAAVFTDNLPLVIGSWYVVFGLLTYLMYWKDKNAAKQGLWRTPEITLHMLSLLGGWPAAWLAQTYLRHKSQKMKFKVIYYVTVVANMALLLFASNTILEI